MDIFFQDPSAIPLPPDEVRIKALRAEPWQDQRRVRVYLELTPFQQRPNGEVSITNLLGEQVASISIIESIVPRMEFTMHLRGETPPGEYQLKAILYYEGESGDAQMSPESRERLVVDQAATGFAIGG